MVERIIEFCARNRFIVLLFVLGFSFMGYMALKNTRMDALPDISDTQVIVYTTWMGRSPDLIEDQVTYPIVTALLSAPKVVAVRGFSDFGFSYVYIIFEDGTDIYWARSRVLEYMSQLSGKLPEGVTPQLGPDATPVGWIYQYALVDDNGKHNLAELRTFQDWYLRYWLRAVPGVSEVASVGGFVKQYQVNLDPVKVLAYNLSVPEIVEKIRMSNNDTGGRVIEFSGVEYMIRGRGYIKSTEDIEKIAVGTNANGTPILLRDVATVQLGSDMRRGVVDLNGQGEAVGGIVIMRFGEDVLQVIGRIKDKLKELASAIPEGIKMVTVYDRSNLIREAISTANWNLIEELVVVGLLIIVFLGHFRSALIPIITLPLAILISFIPIYFLHVGLNIMSIGGIIVAIGDMVDAAIIMVDNAHKRLADWEAKGSPGDRTQVLIDSAKEVGPAIFSSLLVIAISFMPVFTLEAQEGRLFSPLAYTKNLAIFMSALLAITLIPVLLPLLVRGRIIPEQKHPITRWMQAMYAPVLRLALRYRQFVVGIAIVLAMATIPLYKLIGSEFMPPLYEGTILYMPVTLPGISVTQATALLQEMDKKLKAFPEVAHVFGKTGRAETSTDPSPFNMMEVIVELKPKEFWRKGVTYESLVKEMDEALQFPGVSNAWTMPIKARNDMLTTGIRTAVGIKIFGPDIKKIEAIGKEIEMVAKEVKGTSNVYAERVAGGYFLDFQINRDQLARYGLTIMDVNRIIESAVGGENIATTIEGRERYPVNVRYLRELRDDPDKLNRILVKTPSGAEVPVAQLVTLTFRSGPAMVRDENGMLAGYVFIDISGRDIGGYVEELKQAVNAKVKLPPGYTLAWSGQYEFMQRVYERLKIFVPLTLAIIFVLFYFTFRTITETLMVMLGVPFALFGGFLLLYVLGYNMSIAVWVGMIALAGVAAETSAVMLAYLDSDYNEQKEKGLLKTLPDLIQMVQLCAVSRIRPMAMAGLANIIGLLPVMWATGIGADVMKRLAAPMVGGVFSALLLTLIVIPVVYVMWRWQVDLKKTDLTEAR
ncbi:TPA: CusA/CzcA family heavy metal efflux RND transporter [Legionella pneumophila subsp. pneumophila]|uniref:efflux RND transporter permease subunit n=1 Tax=Legionella pneumophila TaxID=446 RepID=UPI00077083CF|nr:CusA/CzcA family heavy metal efflux RND transporter [Legionella pneumophila]MDC8028612.1 CusA/CzcA family heavy metal efflux RND transporter [Legionella pneumophila subsp. pneumophila]MDW8892964.1 CusA/CzcA family heavy metal efflux RND transporter [Legionella pneumophila]CZG14257.1 Cation efflux system protein CusA [Legionella pneumophila]CZG19713.1 Cation efflux system protein CusA [Legionella pneumophila]CZG20355.1 Cation efflux system protein CusA [Legionella pneumophila]